MSIAQAQTVLNKIRTRDYWGVVIRPVSFDENHIPNFAELFPIVVKHSVRFRGWEDPHVDRRHPPLNGADWAGQETNWDRYIEVWRLYLSGQFIHFFAISGEWRDQSYNWPAERGWVQGRYLHYIDAVFEFVEIFEFAARLALSPAGSASMRVEIELRHLRGRRLVSTDIMILLAKDFVTQMPDWS